MPILDKIRLAHITYNNGNNIIRDLTFDLSGQITLMNLENGGGKTVINQCCHAPYLRQRSRIFGKRRFEELFVSPTPSFILHEWLMDDDGGRFIVGLMVCRRQASRVEETEDTGRLSITAFIEEFPLETVHSHIEEYVLSPPSRTYRPSEAMSYLESLAGDKERRLRTYNLSNSSQRNAYESRLKELGISLSEWQQMRDFNQEESGIGKFAERYSTTEKLLNEVLIPCVERKLDAVSSTIGSSSSVLSLIQSNVESYAENLQANQEDLQSWSVYAAFLQALERMEAEEKRVESAIEVRDTTETSIYSWILGIDGRKNKNEDVLMSTRQLLNTTREEIKDLQAQKISSEYYALEDSVKQKEGQRIRDEKQLKEKRAASLQVQYLLNLLSCAEVWKNIQSEKMEIDEQEAKKIKVQAGTRQAEENLQRYGGGYYLAADEEYQNQVECAQSVQEQMETLEAEILQVQQNMNHLNTEIHKWTVQETECRTRLSAYNQQEAETAEKLGITILASMDPYSHDEEVNRHIHRTENTTLNRERDLRRNEKQQEQMQKTLHELRQSIAGLQSQKGMLEEQIRTLEKQAAINETNVERRREIVSRLSEEALLEQRLWEEQWILSSLNTAKVQMQSQADQLHIQMQSIARAVSNLKTGTSAQIDKEVQFIMKKQGISPVFASAWLREGKIDRQLAENYISRFPILPYSLIMLSSQKKSLLAELKEKNIFTSQLLPILEREFVDEIVSGKADASALDAYLYANFNNDLLDTQLLQEKIETLELQKEQCRMQRQSYLEEAERNTADLIWMENSALQKRQYDKVLNDLDITRIALANVQADLEIRNRTEAQYKEQLDGLVIRQFALKKEITDLREAKNLLEKLLSQLRLARKDYLAEQHAILQREAAQEKLEQAEDKKDHFKQDLFDQKIQASKLQIRLHSLQTLLSELEPYKNVEDPEEGDIDWLKTQYEVWKNDSSRSNLREIEKQIAKHKNNLSELKNKLKAKAADADLKQEAIEITPYSLEKELELKKQNRALDHEIAGLQKSLEQQAQEIVRLQTRMENQVQRLRERTGRRILTEREKILQHNWQQEEQELQKMVQECESEIRRLEKEQSELEYNLEQLRDLINTQLFADRHLLSADVEGLKLSALTARVRRFRSELTLANDQLKNEIDFMKNFILQCKNQIPGTFDNLLQIVDSLAEECPNPKQFLLTFSRQKAMVEQFMESVEETRRQNQMLKDTSVKNILDHIQQIYEQISRIDSSMTIQQNQTRVRMLEIVQPVLDPDSELYRQVVEDYVTQSARKMIESGLDHSMIWKLITPQKLYALGVQITQVRVRVRKMEEYRSQVISWDAVAKLSGAECFLSSMIIMLAILYYQRSDAVGHLSSRRHPTAIFMDNPFAYVQSEHILEPFLQLLERTSTQMIALSKVENAAIIKSFPNIYFLHLRLFADQKQHLMAEHVRSGSVSMDAIHLQEEEREEDQEAVF